MSATQSELPSAGLRFVPHLGYRSLEEFPPRQIGDADPRDLLELVAKLAWVVDAQNSRLSVLESLAGSRRLARERRRMARAEV